MTAIFTKKPAAGRVKTRLCPPLAPPQAARLAEAMLADVVARCRDALLRTRLLFTPAAEESWFRKRFPELDEFEPQRGDGLAARLAAFFDGALAEPETTAAVAIGSDAPLIPAARIEEAHRRLDEGAGLVLGPDRGGGYYLVGLRDPHAELFTGIEMSTATMFEETVALARQNGLAVELLEPAYDVDLEQDLLRLREDLAAMDREDGGFPHRTARVLAEILE
ncbi:MAG: TIGR04282 family arsenosugar biosynthesis glycosyltransferase [Planctomycetota bacterium]|nr:TIGR04282 family arsenosugar biosynthesis glycosyltransferase [Planctomycetota bacterium]